MTWIDLTRRVAERSGESRAATQRVLDALLEEVTSNLVEGETVSLPRIGRLSTSWREARTVRSVEDGRRMMLDGRFVPRFRPAAALRERLASKTPQLWRSPEHQAAWRVAETLIGDLALYHGEQAPVDLTPDLPADEVERRCSAAFGQQWARVEAAFSERAPQSHEHVLGLAARRRWAP